MTAATIGTALAEAAARLAEAGIADARREARLVLAHALRLDAATVFARPERPLSPEDAAAVAGFVARRAAREPLSRITGSREFWSLPFRLTPDTLDPRPESETLVQAVLDRIPDRQAPLSLLDLGTGSGCLLLALLSELPRAQGLGVDLNPGAARAAAGNAQALGLDDRARFLAGDWASAVAGRFDVIVANPPYVPDGEVPGLEPEVARWDPQLALAGGRDGLDAIRSLATVLPGLIDNQGIIAVELGAGQDGAATTIFTAAGLEIVAAPQDLLGIVRCLLMRLAKST
jgi:release factor glutamine methyltransferase